MPPKKDAGKAGAGKASEASPEDAAAAMEAMLEVRFRNGAKQATRGSARDVRRYADHPLPRPCVLPSPSIISPG